MIRFSSVSPVVLVLCAGTFLAGCTQNGRPAPVFGAVFGLEGADVAPYRVGKIAEPVLRTGDRVIGQAANEPEQCIYLRDGRTRFRAPCPDGFSP